MKIKKTIQFINGLEFSVESDQKEQIVFLTVRPEKYGLDPIIEVRMSSEEARSLGNFISDASWGK